MIFRYILCALLAYLMGNFSSATFLSKWFTGQDIREQGSGNAGTANMFRVHGYKLAISTLALDMLKGLFAVWLGRLVGREIGGYVAAVAVVCGHNWPVILGFRGGKGVATSIGVIFAVNWQAGLIMFLCGLIIVAITRMFALAAIIGAAVYALVVIITERQNMPLVVTVIILAGMVIFQHRSNIKRMLHGEESKAEFHKRVK